MPILLWEIFGAVVVGWVAVRIWGKQSPATPAAAAPVPPTAAAPPSTGPTRFGRSIPSVANNFNNTLPGDTFLIDAAIATQPPFAAVLPIATGPIQLTVVDSNVANGLPPAPLQNAMNIGGSDIFVLSDIRFPKPESFVESAVFSGMPALIPKGAIMSIVSLTPAPANFP